MSEPVGQKQRMARGLLTLGGGRGVVMSLQFLAVGLLANHLGPAQLGVYTFGLAIAAVFRLVPNFGLIPVVTRDIAQQPERERSLLPNLVYMRVALGVFAYVLLAGAVQVLGVSQADRQAALVAGLVLLVVNDSFRATVEVRLRVAWISLADTTEAVLTVLGTLWLVHRNAGPTDFVWLYVALKLVNASILTVVAMRMTRFDWAVRRDLWGPVTRAAIPLGIAGVFQALYYRLDIVILADLKTAGDVGQYGAAYRFLEASLVLPAITMSVLGPVLSRSVREGGDVLQRRFGHVMLLISVPAVLVALVGGATAWRVLPRIPGFGAFSGAGVALSILAPAASLILLGTVVQAVLISAHEQRRLVTISAVGLAVNVVLNFALIPSFSYVGASVATTVTELVLLWLSVRAVRARVGISWPAERVGRLAALTLVTAVVLGAGYWLNPFLQLGLAVAAFVGLAPVLGVLRADDVRPFLPRRVVAPV